MAEEEENEQSSEHENTGDFCLPVYAPDVGFGSCTGGSDAVGSPSCSQALVSEGDLALRLCSAPGVTTTSDVVEAENLLGDLGIAPRNGWISDYPVTPDIIVELQNAVAAAACWAGNPFSLEPVFLRTSCIISYEASRLGATVEDSGASAMPPDGDETRQWEVVS